jgi:hypothetical protein
MTARSYPLPRPEGDPRFTYGLHFEIGAVLEAHGYPKLSGTDFVDLGQALFRFLYAAEEQSGVDVEDDSPLTFAEYRSALAHWEQRAAEAQAAGDQAAIAYRTQGVETLRRYVTRAEAVAQRGELHLDLSDEALAALAARAGQGVAR